jgi:hypothetical protein
MFIRNACARGSILIVPWPSRRMVYVEDLHRIVRDAIENPVWIPSDRGNANTGTLRGAWRAFRPALDVGDDLSETLPMAGAIAG